MNKIISLTLVLILMVFSCQAYAEIGKEVDAFDNTTSIYSKVTEEGPWETTRFSIIREGYGRRKYKKDYVKFLIYALSSNDETSDHLETLYEVKSLKNKIRFKRISQ